MYSILNLFFSLFFFITFSTIHFKQPYLYIKKEKNTKCMIQIFHISSSFIRSACSLTSFTTAFSIAFYQRLGPQTSFKEWTVKSWCSSVSLCAIQQKKKAFYFAVCSKLFKSDACVCSFSWYQIRCVFSLNLSRAVQLLHHIQSRVSQADFYTFTKGF